MQTAFVYLSPPPKIFLCLILFSLCNHINIATGSFNTINSIEFCAYMLDTKARSSRSQIVQITTYKEIGIIESPSFVVHMQLTYGCKFYTEKFTRI